MRFEPGTGRVSRQCPSGVSGGGNGQLRGAHIFRHGNGDRHAARFETLRRILRFVLDPEIGNTQAAAKSRGPEQRRSTFTQRDRLHFGRQREHLAITPQ